MKLVATAVLLACLAVLTGCGGGSTSSINPNGQVSGNWQIALQRAPKSSKTLSGFILQLSDSVTGGLMLSGSCAGVGSATGTMTGQNISLDATVTGQALNLGGTVSSDGSTMTGTYTILASGCGNSETGTWSATRVKPLSGSFHGTLTSTRPSGIISDVSGMITQGPNGGQSSAVLSGAITSTDSPCFSSATLSGVISGTTVVLTITAADGSALGQFFSLTTTTNGTSLTGKYSFLSQLQLPPGTPCRSGDAGTLSITLP
jgi:hypothetical protein